MAKYDISGLLYKQAHQDRFINILTISDSDLSMMREARTKVRNALKSAFTRAKSDPKFLVRLDEEDQAAFKSIEPRFWPQGSFAYGTQNLPAHTPPQQLDIDDGIYLPIESMRDRPIVSKEIFFEIVDSALGDLAKQEKDWEFIGDNDKCARIELSSRMHLDVPLYAIPLERFDDLQKAMGRAALTEAMAFEDGEIRMRRMLAENEVYIALRNKGHWKKSDPIRIQEWFEAEQQLFGPRLTRVCRYLKAWRDHRWRTGGPSSIALMVVVWEVFSSARQPFASDSEALFAVCKALPDKLKNGVINPVADDEVIYPRNIETNEHEYDVAMASAFSREFLSALNSAHSSQEVVSTCAEHWGTRFPTRHDWVVASAAIVQGIESTPASKQPKRDVGTMRSGYRSG